MSKEYERFKKRLPQRERFFRRCAGLAFGRLHREERLNWLRAICASEEKLRVAVLREFVDVLAKEMARAEYRVRPHRGRRPKIEETAMIEADAQALRLPLPEVIQKTGVARTMQTAKKKAAAIRSRKYRAKKK
jgi:hypothetical protein